MSQHPKQTSLNLHRNIEVRQCLESLNERAKRGEIQGFFWTSHTGDMKHDWGVSGTYRDMPDLAVAKVERAHEDLKVYAQFKRIDPHTASIVLADEVVDEVAEAEIIPWLKPFALKK